MIRKTGVSEVAWDRTPRLDTGLAENQVNWPYWVQPRFYTVTQMLNIDLWVRATFGDSTWQQSCAGPAETLWVGSHRKYWFSKQSDRTMFVMRWA